MKRVLAIVLGLCLLSGLSVNADIDTIEGSTIAGGEGEASCDSPSEQYSYTSGADGYGTIRGVNGAYGDWQGQRAAASVPATYSICSIEAEVLKQGSPNGSLYCDVWSDSGGSPDAIIATSDGLAVSGISTGVVELFFTGADRVTITQGVVYHYMFYVDGDSTYDSGNRLRLHYDSGSTPAANEILENSSDYSNFTTYNDTGAYLVINGQVQ
jgi:hypothetical protein